MARPIMPEKFYTYQPSSRISDKKIVIICDLINDLVGPPDGPKEADCLIRIDPRIVATNGGVWQWLADLVTMGEGSSNVLTIWRADSHTAENIDHYPHLKTFNPHAIEGHPGWDWIEDLQPYVGCGNSREYRAHQAIMVLPEGKQPSPILDWINDHTGNAPAEEVEIYLAGVWTDYMIQLNAQVFTALGFRVKVIEPACMSQQPAKHHEAIRQMAAYGHAQIIKGNECLSKLAESLGIEPRPESVAYLESSKYFLLNRKHLEKARSFIPAAQKEAFEAALRVAI
ncbi:MAG: isochorismatase family protein [Acidobacteriota bacterium]|nr:isochorismatase family protein [Blastocatellia bacterium]MDW8413715.1 isochorismatase family protein [Acidobacteriota bacterium]